MKKVYYSLAVSLCFVSIILPLPPKKLDTEFISLLQTVDLGNSFGRMKFENPYIVFQKCSKINNEIEKEIRYDITNFVSIENNLSEAVTIHGMAENRDLYTLLSVKNRRAMITFILLKITNRKIEMVESRELERGKYQMKLSSTNGRFFMKVK